MPRNLALSTAYARAIADPLTITIDEDTFTIDPTLDVTRCAMLFAQFQDGLDSVGDKDIPLADRVVTMEAKKHEGLAALAQCMVEEDRQRFTDIGSHVDIKTLSQLVAWVLSEVSGMDPTQPESSGAGSSPTTTTSTDGAPLTDSTPSD